MIYTDRYSKHEMAVFEAVKTYLTETMPDFPWGRFWDLSRSLNAELWHGPLGTEFWGADGADPLEHYEWAGYEQAEKDMRELIGQLPSELFYDGDCDFVSDQNPDDDENNWEDEMWVGGYSWEKVNVAEALLPREVWSQIR